MESWYLSPAPCRAAVGCGHAGAAPGHGMASARDLGESSAFCFNPVALVHEAVTLHLHGALTRGGHCHTALQGVKLTHHGDAEWGDRTHTVTFTK